MDSEAFNNIMPDYKGRTEIIEYLKSSYPFINHGKIANSVCNRTIDYIQIGNPQKQVLLAGAFHGMEWLTSLVLLKFANDICDAIQNKKLLSEVHIEKFLEQRAVTIVPCVNPDGVEISLYGSQNACEYKDLVERVSNNNTSRWQANARGVDLNHNFNAGWDALHKLEISQGITGPAMTRYGGPYPESEPESHAIANFCRDNYIEHALAFHSQGEEIYWDFGENTPKKSKSMANIMAISSGYKVASPQGLAIGGGFKDWFITEFSRPAFTIEIGKGINPLPLSDIDPIYKKINEMLVLSIIM